MTTTAFADKIADELAAIVGPNQKANVGSGERLVSLLLGALILLALRGRPFVYVGAALAALYLLYRGVTGHCRVYEAAGFHTTDFQLGGGSIIAPWTGTENEERESVSRPDSQASNFDRVDEALLESFPASDPPAVW